MWSRGALAGKTKTCFKPPLALLLEFTLYKEMRIPQKPRISKFFCGRKITNIHHCFANFDYLDPFNLLLDISFTDFVIRHEGWF